jgi:hypothetical protein
LESITGSDCPVFPESSSYATGIDTQLSQVASDRVRVADEVEVGGAGMSHVAVDHRRSLFIQDAEVPNEVL